MEPYKIILADDHQIVLDGLDAILADYPDYEVIAKAQNGKEAVQLVGALQPHLILLDIDMPVLNGLMAAKEIKQLYPDTKIIILSLHRDGSIIRKLIQYGVDGYLIKSTDSSEMMTAIDMVRKGKTYFSGEVTLQLSQKNSSPKADGSIKISILTERELEVLQAIVEGHSSKEIGKLLNISARTVDTHRNNMMKKLEVKKVVGLIRWAIRWGLAKVIVIISIGNSFLNQ